VTSGETKLQIKMDCSANSQFDSGNFYYVDDFSLVAHVEEAVPIEDGGE